VSVAAAQDSISTGFLLKRSTLLLLRHGWSFPLTTAAVGFGSFLALYLAGHCFLSITTACVSSPVYGWIGESAMAVQYEVATSGARLATKIVLTIALWFLFILAESRRSPASGRRCLRFVGRMIVYWVVFEVPNWFFDFVMAQIAAALGPENLLGGWLAFIGMTLVALLFFSYLHAKLILYVVSGVYDEQPQSFRESWNATSEALGALFRAFLALELFSVVVYFAFWYLGQWVPGMTTLSERIARWSGVESDVAYYVVPADIGDGLASVFMALMTAAMSVVAYRAMVARELHVAAVFE
jgi:hypothetical protein